MDHQLWTHARIRVHGGKNHVWNRVGTKPVACDVLQQRAEALDPDTRDRVWRGLEVPHKTRDQSFGHTVGPSQMSSLLGLLLLHCRVNESQLCAACGGMFVQHLESIARMSTTPMALGGLGLRSAERNRWPTSWSNWANTMIEERLPGSGKGGAVRCGFIKIWMKVVNFIKKNFIKNHFHQKPQPEEG